MHEPVSQRIGDQRCQRLNLNVYDSVFLPDIKEHRVKMFGGVNIGHNALTNLQIPHQILPGDWYAVLHNWYARVGYCDDPGDCTPAAIERSYDRAAWAEATIVTFVLGMMPVHQVPLADLLRRREGQKDELLEHEPSVEMLARRAFDMHQHQSMVSQGWPAWEWDKLPDYARRGWIAATKFTRSQLRSPLLAAVPDRQTVTVTLETDMKMLGRVVEAGPRDHLRVWIHLEGIACNDYGTVIKRPN